MRSAADLLLFHGHFPPGSRLRPVGAGRGAAPGAAYEPEELTAFLREAGFRDIRQYGNLKLRPPREGEDRIFFVARKDPNMTGQV